MDLLGDDYPFSSTALKGKHAFVCGASKGIGEATAKMMAKAGADITVCARNGAALTALCEELTGLGGGQHQALMLNLEETEGLAGAFASAAETLGPVHILINNAATTNFLRFDDLDALTEDHWDRVLQTNVKAPFYMVRAARRWLEASTEGGEIIHITSIAGMTGNGSSLAYCASKAALINMTLSMARILAPKIRVNAVAPGFIADQWTQQGLGERYGAAVQTHTQKALLGKVSEPEDVAMAVLSLITGSDMITGQNLVCDGGSMIGPRA